MKKTIRYKASLKKSDVTLLHSNPIYNKDIYNTMIFNEDLADDELAKTLFAIDDGVLEVTIRPLNGINIYVYTRSV